jgi:hypothetical protein
MEKGMLKLGMRVIYGQSDSDYNAECEDDANPENTSDSAAGNQVSNLMEKDGTTEWSTVIPNKNKRTCSCNVANEQYGFRNNQSTYQATYHLTNILKALDGDLLVGGIFYDLTNDFDYINHDFLLALWDTAGLLLNKYYSSPT